MLFEAFKNNKSYYVLDNLLEYIPEKYKTYEPFLDAVKGGFYIHSVPEEHKTYELCLEAVKNNGTNLRYVPEEHKKFNLCLVALENMGDANEWSIQEFLKNVPEENKNFKFYLHCIRSGIDIKNVPEKYKNSKLCLETVKHKRFASSKYKDKNEIFKRAIEYI